MAQFKYKGRDKHGQLIEGVLEGISQNQVATKLINAEITPTLIDPIEEGPQLEKSLANLLRINTPNSEDLVLFSQQMYTLLKAQVPLIRALQVTGNVTQNKQLRGVLTDIIINLESGLSFSNSLKKHPHVFSSLYVAMIHVGENTGQLDFAFLQIRNYLSSDIEIVRRIKNALRYPMMVLAAILIAFGIINFMVIPAFHNFFTAFGAVLPLPTRILIACSDFLVQEKWWLLSILAVTIIGFSIFFRTPRGDFIRSYLVIHLPFMGNILKSIMIARFCRAFAITISSRVPLLQAFHVIADVVDNAYFAEKIHGMRHSIARGESLHNAAINSGLFSPIVLQMLVIADETGELDKLLLEVAEYYEKEVDYSLKRLSDFIEPILIMIIALLVLILALGVFLPMWDISTVFFHKMQGL